MCYLTLSISNSGRLHKFVQVEFCPVAGWFAFCLLGFVGLVIFPLTSFSRPSLGVLGSLCLPAARRLTAREWAEFQSVPGTGTGSYALFPRPHDEEMPSRLCLLASPDFLYLLVFLWRFLFLFLSLRHTQKRQLIERSLSTSRQLLGDYDWNMGVSKPRCSSL